MESCCSGLMIWIFQGHVNGLVNLVLMREEPATTPTHTPPKKSHPKTTHSILDLGHHFHIQNTKFSLKDWWLLWGPKNLRSALLKWLIGNAVLEPWFQTGCKQSERLHHPHVYFFTEILVLSLHRVRNKASRSRHTLNGVIRCYQLKEK